MSETRGGAPKHEPIADPQILDARLLPSALTCWGVTILAVASGWRTGLVVAAVLLLSSIVLGAWMFRRRAVGTQGVAPEGRVDVGARRVAAEGRIDVGMRRVAAAVLAALLLGTGFACAASWQQYCTATHPLRAAAPGTYLTVVVVPTDDPKPLPAKPFGGRRWMLRAELREYQHGEVAVSTGGSVVVLLRENQQALLPGQPVRLRVRLDRPWRNDLTLAVLRAEGPPTPVGTAPWWQRVAGTVRTRLAEAATRVLPPDAAGLLPGLVDGDISHLSDEVRENFKQTDLTHLIAVSGTNVTIILAAVLLSVRAATVDLRWGVLLSVLALVMFVILARPSPTVLRAAVMGAIAVLAVITGRRKQALPALCAAVIGLIALSPALALDIGFALSVFATAGLVLLAPGWSQWLENHGWHHIPAEAFSVATAAFLLTIPMIAALTGHIGPLAILANVLVEPVIAPLTILGTLAAILCCPYPPAADAVLWLTGPPLRWLLFVSERGASLNISLSVPSGLTGGLAVASVVAVLLALFAREVRSPPDE
ncbi:ComEC/Rec2 family competence protein [Nocardia terpenica]|uniref:ComEC/Rec2-related protein domain-containing protein n=1 Tax=Nocardia terpenica TaxID=455432 RepID=A0A291RGZ8_9NOCA|nr:ComEC/Rec2 family competence protein [Nocardia terpenica]ATL66579.1 hypothetical protein CRH09_10535 [Nocardia terpenica]